MEAIRNLSQRFPNALFLDAQFSRGYIMEHRCILLAVEKRDDENRAIVGVCDPHLSNLLTEIESALVNFHQEITSVNFNKIEYEELLALLGTQTFSSDEGFIDPSPGLRTQQAKLDTRESEGPIISLVNTILLEALNRDVSDIHISSSRSETRIRFRENGMMQDYRNLPRNQFESIILRIKHLAGLNILERRLPQDGRVTITIENRLIDTRISTVPTIHGESMVLRLLNQRSVPLDFEYLGFVSAQISYIRRMLSGQHGIILVTGPTGSGKTTTLHTMLNVLKEGRTRQIIAIEDPVEIESDGIEQIQVNEAIDLSFSSLLRRVLRQDPDIIMVGEMRDIDTAELAIRAALTGHLVLSTLHTNAALPSVDRLRDMGIQNYLIAATLKGIVSQQLVPILCDCDEKSGSDCPKCRGTKISGRQVISEIVEMNKELSKMIHSGASISDLETAPSLNRITMSEHISLLDPEIHGRIVLPKGLFGGS